MFQKPNLCFKTVKNECMRELYIYIYAKFLEVFEYEVMPVALGTHLRTHKRQLIFEVR